MKRVTRNVRICDRLDYADGGAARDHAGETARADQPGKPSVEEVRRRLAAQGGLDKLPRQPHAQPAPMTPDELRLLAELRPTHTLAELAEIFGRHPSTLSKRSGVRTDLRRRELRERREAERSAAMLA